MSAMYQVLLPAVMFALVVFVNSKIAITLMVLFVYLITDWFSVYFSILPRSFTWVSDIIILLLLTKLIVLSVFERKKLQSTPIDLLVLLFFFAAITSMIINNIPPIIALVTGFRKAFISFILFYVVVNLDFHENFYKKIINFLIVIALLQVPITLLQTFVWFPGQSVDYRGGTLGVNATGATALWVSGIISIIIAFSLNNPKMKWQKFFVTILLIPTFIGRALAVLYFLPTTLLFLLSHGASKKLGKYLMTGCAILILLGAADYVNESVFGDKLGFERLYLTPNYAVDYESVAAEGGSYMGRLQIINYTNQLLAQKTSLFLGLGPGAGGHSEWRGLQGTQYTEFTDFARTQLSRTLIEFGFFGLLVNFLIIYQVYRMNKKFFVKIDDIYWKSVSHGFFGIIFLFTAATVYANIWYSTPIAFSFWFIAGAIFNVGKNRGIL
ncbi:MAG: hypothetical protein O6943_08480 [Bacteroidetes bacterium]|nr:hypothetical protein [Bacteroidota bacterium]